jgi:hypothetical protein
LPPPPPSQLPAERLKVTIPDVDFAREPDENQLVGQVPDRQVALKLAKAGSGHYLATTEDGRPVNSCYPFRIRFQIKN